MKNPFTHVKPRSDSLLIPSDIEPDAAIPLIQNAPNRERTDVLEPNQLNVVWEAAKNNCLSGRLSKAERAMILNSPTVENLICRIQRDWLQLRLSDTSDSSDPFQIPLSDEALLELQTQARTRSLSCKAVTVVASCFCDRLDLIARASGGGVLAY
jgi:hypothetical protein